MQAIRGEIKNFLAGAGVKGKVELAIPPKPEMGDFSFACFAVAKEQKKSPAEVAKEIKLKVESRKLKAIERVEAVGPYVNFYLKTGEIAEMIIKEILKKKEKYGNSKIGKGKKVLIEYPSNNTHKEFHVGHLRNVCIGNALTRLYQKNGYKAYAVNYLNDFGNHVARCLWGLLKFHKDEINNPPENKQKWLGEIYAEASQKVKDNPEYAKEAAEMQKKLEERGLELWPLFMKTRQWSMDKFQEIFKELDVKHQAVFYEKDLKDKGQKIVDDLLRKGVAQIGEGGAVIVDLTKYKLDVAMLRKSDGSGLYLTSDLPLATAKFKKFNVDESVVITGVEQNFYFKQLHKILEIIGFKNKLTHIGYGLVNLKEGKMSSRLGNVILYEDLRDEVYEKLKAETRQRHADWSEKQVNQTARALAMAALKFDMQKHEAAKNIIFDVKEAASFNGFTGPYILYVVARINSILKKAKGKRLKVKEKFDLLDKAEEKQLLLLLAKFEEVAREALAQYNPSVITRYCFDLGQQFNDFYNKHNILNAENKELTSARLQLAVAVKTVLTNALNLLSIDTAQEM